ncbi:zinc ribbon domain-containing protein [Xanthobacter sediminis]
MAIVLFMFLLIVHPAILGWISQTKRNQIGILWACATLALNIILSLFMDNAIRSNPRFIFDPAYRQSINTAGHDIAFFLFVVVPSTAIILIALFTLPRRSERSKENKPNADHHNKSAQYDVKICPACAEQIKSAAIVCRFCGYTFTPDDEEQRIMSSDIYRGYPFIQNADYSVKAEVAGHNLNFSNALEFREFVDGIIERASADMDQPARSAASSSLPPPLA